MIRFTSNLILEYLEEAIQSILDDKIMWVNYKKNALIYLFMQVNKLGIIVALKLLLHIDQNNVLYFVTIKGSLTQHILPQKAAGLEGQVLI